MIRNKHWSPFEHSFLTVEIETSRAIGTQLLRHRSFTFQELSQRYAKVDDIVGESMFEPIELRRSGTTNRQSSIEDKDFDPRISIEDKYLEVGLTNWASDLIISLQNLSKDLYDKLIENGVAAECARFVLPLCTKTRIHMTGSIRSWIHFLDLRDDSHAQKEARIIAQMIKNIFIEQFPIISNALEYKVTNFES